MAPESSSAVYDEKVDIFSAAVTFYELFEQANWDPDMPFAFALTPGKGGVAETPMRHAPTSSSLLSPQRLAIVLTSGRFPFTRAAAFVAQWRRSSERWERKTQGAGRRRST